MWSYFQELKQNNRTTELVENNRECFSAAANVMDAWTSTSPMQNGRGKPANTWWKAFFGDGGRVLVKPGYAAMAYERPVQCSLSK